MQGLSCFQYSMNQRTRAWLGHQLRSYYKSNDGVLPRRESRRTLAKTRSELSSQSGIGSRNILLPPFVSPGELRILLGIEYKSALSLCRVKMYQQKYYWSDLEGRWFETSNKRKILVPFDSIAANVRMFGLNPILVNPDPLVPVAPSADRIPALSIFGKTELKIPLGLTSKIGQESLTVLPQAISATMRGRLIAHSDAVVMFDEDCEEEFHVMDLCHRFNVPLVRLPVSSSMENVSAAVRAELSKRPTSTDPVDQVDPLAFQFRKEKKRTDILVDAEKPPVASAVVLDVMKAVETGKVGLVLVKRGTLRIGQNFVAGSGFGKITNIWTMDNQRLETAGPGMLVKVGRLAKDTGDFAPDDYFHVFPRERAWRLAFHRERIEWLNSFQTEGKKLPAEFEFDSGLENSKTHAETVSDDSVRAEKVIANNNYIENDEEEDSPLDYKKVARIRASLMEHRRGSILVEPVEAQKLRTMIHKETNEIEEERVGQALPDSRPVIPLIIKTESSSQFDAILDAIELIEEEHRIKLPVVHGGIGPVAPNDLVHAEIESKYSHCPVYAVGTSSVPEALASEGAADRIVEFRDVDQVVSAIRQRVRRFTSLNNRNRYSSSLSRNRKGNRLEH